MEILEVQVYAASLKARIVAAIDDFISATGTYPIIDITTKETKTDCQSITTTSVKVLTELA